MPGRPTTDLEGETTQEALGEMRLLLFELRPPRAPGRASACASACRGNCRRPA